MSLRMRGAMTAVAGVLALAATAAAGPLQDDLAARRARLMEKLGPDAMAIVWSAPTRVYSLDVDYEFRQDSHLLYLTGMTQEETILVLMPGNRTRKEILFTREPNPRREHWNGHILTKEEATAQSGIATVYYAGEFEAFVTAMFNQQALRRQAQRGVERARRLLRRGGRQPRPARPGLRPAAGALGAADPGLRVRRQGPRSLPQRRVRGHLADDLRAAPDQDHLRADPDGEERAHLQQRAHGRDGRGQAGTLRVRGGSRRSSRSTWPTAR